MRMIICLKVLIESFLVPLPKFQMESVRKLCSSLRTGNFLSPCRYLRSITEKSCFAVNKRKYEFQVLSFGISVVPWLFTRITNPITSLPNLQLVHLHGYLDDFLMADQDGSQLKQNKIFLIQLMTYHGEHWCPFPVTNRTCLTPRRLLCQDIDNA